MLRLMHENDLERVLEWRNHQSVRQNMYTSHVISMAEHETWWKSTRSNSRRIDLIFESGSPLGVINFTNINPINKTADWAFYKHPDSPKGTGSRMEKAALEYAFKNLDLEKLSCEVLAYNEPVIGLHRKYGFQVEGIFRKAHVFEGKRHDIYRLALSRDEWCRATNHELVGLKTTLEFSITSEDVSTFASLTKDYNPLHFEAGFAKLAGFDGPIAHGMLTSAVFSRLFAKDFPGLGTIYLSQNLRFIGPVYYNQALIATTKVLSQVGRKLRIATQVTDKGTGEMLIRGEAEVLMPNAFNSEPNEKR